MKTANRDIGTRPRLFSQAIRLRRDALVSLLSNCRTSGKRSLTMIPSNPYLMVAFSAPMMLGTVFMATFMFNAMAFGGV